MSKRKSSRPDRKDERKTNWVQSDFPKHALESALRIVQALHDKNGGRPLPPTETAHAVGLSPGSSDYRALLSSSIRYGLTAGSYNGDRISIAPLGQEIVEPTDPESRAKALVAASLTSPTFRAIYETFRGKKLPEGQFFQNTIVREFGVPREHAAKCVEIFVANAEFLQLITDTSTGRWLRTDVSLEPISEVTAKSAPDDNPAAQAAEEVAEVIRGVESPRESKGEAIFLGHGRNKKPLEQLTKILSEYRIPFKVATEEANKGRPISEKVAQIMQECSAAILIFTPDEEYRDLNGNPVWKPSENVTFELGAASVLYGKQVVIFKEQSVDFPTNFRDLGHIPFSGDDLAAKTNELFRELISFGLIKISVG